MEKTLELFILIPIAGFIVSLLIPQKNEGLLSKSAFLTIGIHLASAITFLGYWLLNNHPILNLKDIVIFKTSDYEFFIDFCFDNITAVYLVVGALLTFLVTVYSRVYLHKEHGYKRFFNAILLFYLGYTIIIFSGNLETLFIGWEILGVSSFLLIAFYRERYLPVKNAVKVFSIYRIGDLGLILAMWLSHHLWHENITFLKLNNYELVHEHLATHSTIGVLISLFILLTAVAKSAQLPFSHWLPRAMEGPTPSSAIFYGSLSVHIGVFLLLRTFPFWEHQLSVRILIVIIGLSTSIIASVTAHVQSSVKSQIAYASIAQIGLIFIEVSLGLKHLALFHFSGNAFLRTYQLLVSPSVVSYLIKEQFYKFSPQIQHTQNTFYNKIKNSIYVLCVKEWNLDTAMYRFLWNPLKSAGNKLNFKNNKQITLFFSLLFTTGVICLLIEKYIPAYIHNLLPPLFSIVGLIMVLKSFTERKNVQLSWILIIANHFWIGLAISFNEHFTINDTLMYLSGIFICGVAGVICLFYLQSKESNVGLNRFYGHIYEYPKLAIIFLIC
ncbi:MAG: hypothetical protein J0M08_08675, partial [Bacteroidetes bacterium]|nr:hypothetical protein [Bacteroidota bacterium]